MRRQETDREDAPVASSVPGKQERSTSMLKSRYGLAMTTSRDTCKHMSNIPRMPPSHWCGCHQQLVTGRTGPELSTSIQGKGLAVQLSTENWATRVIERALLFEEHACAWCALFRVDPLVPASLQHIERRARRPCARTLSRCSLHRSRLCFLLSLRFAHVPALLLRSGVKEEGAVLGL